jgi:aspartyl-tRNA(Asn)/glutamyl-tRNA(Gln) amidotransferase subunit A
MADLSLTHKEISELSALMLSGQVSAREVVAAFVSNLELHNVATNAFIAFDAEKALARASTVDALRGTGKTMGVLSGIPLAVKDNYLTLDFPTTAGSRVYDANPPKSDARTVALLREAGAIVLGKTNMHEWAYGATNKISAKGPTRNPWNTQHITGGSSGGSGAALAARMVPAALGSDTGGSIRVPAAGCGVCGIKPSYDFVSREGVLPLSWTLDAAGPMATSARDLRILLSVMIDKAGPGFNGSKADKARTPTAKRKMRLGMPIGLGFELANDVRSSFESAQEIFTDLGAEVVPVETGEMMEGFAAWKTILHSEATAFHVKFLSERANDYADSVRTQLEAGRCITAADYLNAQQFRRGFNDRLDVVMSAFDAFILPTLPVTAPLLDEEFLHFEGVSVSAQDSMTYVAWLANLAGLPALSIPCGFGKQGLPVGLMLMGRFGTDFDLLGIGELFQTATDWHRRTPTFPSHSSP